jgi:hypothetical protein
MEARECGSCGNPVARLYACGLRCAGHTPARLAGKPEPDTGRYCAPNRCYCGTCPSWTERPVYTDNLQRTTVDARAVASGKRRSSPAGYRSAQATVR